MQIPSDYKELLNVFNKHKVKYLIIGAYAVIYYTEPRYTKDFDILIEPSLENAQKVYAALKEFGAPLEHVTVDDFTNQNLVYQMGVAPVRVDILMGLKGMDFEAAWKSRSKGALEGIKVNIIALKDLMTLKRATKRDMDKRDLQELRYKWKKQRRI